MNSIVRMNEATEDRGVLIDLCLRIAWQNRWPSLAESQLV